MSLSEHALLHFSYYYYLCSVVPKTVVCVLGYAMAGILTYVECYLSLIIV